MSIIRDTDSDWKRIAEEDPYWGVLSADAYRKDVMTAQKVDQFMASGAVYVDDLFSFVRKHISPEFDPVRALDVGCGVGRLAIPMARKVREVVGVDIAPAMLELCSKHAAEAGVCNITLCEGDDELSCVLGKFDLVNTYIVLQHVPPERGYRIIQSMLDRLNIGGVGSMQLTYAKARRFLAHESPKALFYRREGGALIDIMDSGWRPPEGSINMFDYDLNQVAAQIAQVAGAPILMLPTNDDSHLGVHFVFQRVR